MYADLMGIVPLPYAPSEYMQSSPTCSSEPQNIGCGKSTAVDHWSVAVFNTSFVAILLIAGHPFPPATIAKCFIYGEYTCSISFSSHGWEFLCPLRNFPFPSKTEEFVSDVHNINYSTNKRTETVDIGYSTTSTSTIW